MVYCALVFISERKNNMKKTEPIHTVYEMDNIYDGVVKQAQRYGDKSRYIYKVGKEERNITYNDMLDRVNYISSALDVLGMAGKNIVITGDSHPDYVTTYVSTVSTGGVIVPLDKDIQAEQYVNFIKLCESKAVFYTASLESKIESILPELDTVELFVPIDLLDKELPDDPRFKRFEDVYEIGKKAYEEGNRAAENYEVDMEKTCAILFTSGTTGTSKGVMLNQRNLVTATIDCCYIMAVSEKDLFLSVLPFHHAYEFVAAQFALPNTGASTVINDSVKNTLRNIQKYKPNALVLVPLYVETMHKKLWSEIEKKGKTKTVRNAFKISNALRKIGIDRRRQLFKEILDAFGGNLEFIVCGGASLRPELIQDFENLGIMICEGYGITECAPLISANPMTWRKYHSVGLKVPHMDVKIIKDSEDAETGEIAVKGPAVFQGYYKNEETTKEVFTEDGWFKTGDIGYMDSDNFIFITGRKKNVIILSNGKNVFPEELEEHLGVSEYIQEVCVIGRKDEESGEVKIWALVYPNMDKFEGVSNEEIEAKIKAEVDEVNKKMPVYKHIPNVEVRYTEFEKSTSRKILRYKLK